MSLKYFRVQESHFVPALFHQLSRLMWIMLMLSAYGSHDAAAQTPPPAALQISAGGSANGSWSADEYFSGGNTDTHSVAINTLFDSRPAPQSIYQSERWGVMTYTMPGVDGERTIHSRSALRRIVFQLRGRPEALST
jgi:hypothetical protein